MEKLKVCQHLQLRDENSLSAQVWELDKEGKLVGLAEEMEWWIRRYQLPRPDKEMSMCEYKRLAKAAVRKASRTDIWEQLLESRKVSYLANFRQDRAPQMGMTDLKKIEFLTRCRLSSLFEFNGDFGSDKLCPCGEKDTMGHVRRGCPLYRDLLPADTSALQILAVADDFYTQVLERKTMLRLSS